MAKSRTFGGVTTAVWQCVKSTSLQEHGTKYVPADADQGTATTDTVVGTVELSFDYNAQKDSVSYKIIKKTLHRFRQPDLEWYSGHNRSLLQLTSNQF